MKKNKNKIFLLAISLQLLFAVNLLYSQSFTVKNYTENDGLPSSEVYQVVQDGEGYIWFATRAGMAKYNGADWEIFPYKDDFFYNGNEKILVDGDGTLWRLVSSVGIEAEYFEDNQWKDYNHKFTNSNIHPYCFNIIANKGDTILATGTLEEGLFINSKNKWISYSVETGFLSDIIHQIIVVNNKFYIATGNGIAIIDGDKVDYSLNALLPKDKRVLWSIAYKHNKLWVLGNNFVGYIENNKFYLTKEKIKLNLNERSPRVSILPVSNNKLLISTAANSYLINPKTKKVLPLGELRGLINNRSAYSLFEDREKNIWISGAYGVSKIPKIKFFNYTSAQGLYRDEVSAIEEIAPGKYIFGQDYGYTIKDKNGLHKYSLEGTDDSKIGFSKILDIASDHNGNVWIAGEKLGFGKLLPDYNIKFFPISYPISESAASIVIKKDGSVWGLTTNHLLKFADNKFTTVELKRGEYLGFLRKLFVTPDDKLAIASSQSGILIKNEKELTRIASSKDNKLNNTYYILFDDERTFVGTKGGLAIVEGEKLIQFNEKKFSISRPVYFIAKDQSSTYWFGTDKGVIKWNGHYSEQYGKNEGLSGHETNRDAGYVDSNGDVWIGTNGGVSKYVEDFDVKRKIAPIIKIKSVKTNSTPLNLEMENELSYSQNTLDFTVEILSFVNENKNKYRYYLEGLENDWSEPVDAVNRKITFHHLPPGSFKLFVQAISVEGVKSKIVSSKTFTISKPFYSTGTFYILLFLIIIALIYIAINYFISKKYTAKLEEEIDLRTNKLKEAEKKYTQMFEENRAVMLIIEPHSGKIIDANAAALIYYGYSRSVILEKNFKQIDYLYDEEFEIYNKRNESSTNYYLTQHIISGNTLRDVEVYFTVVEQNDKVLLYAIVHDVSDRIKVEKELNNSEQKYRGVVGAIQDVVFVVQEGKFVFVNEAIVPILGYEIDELLNEDFSNFIWDEEKELILDRYKRRIEGYAEPEHYEVRMKHKNGKPINMLLNVSIVEFEGKESLVGTAKDITQIKKSEDTLRKLSMAIEQSPVSIIITDLEGSIEYVNPTFTTITGYDFTEVFRKNPRLLKSESSPQKDYQKLWKTIKAGNIWHGEFLNRKKSGELFWVSAVISPVKNGQGIITNFIAVEQDITFDKFAKDELKCNENLFNSVFNNVPVVLFVLNREGKITLARGKVMEEHNITEERIIGRRAEILFRRNKEIKRDILRATSGESFKCKRFVANRSVEVSYTPIFDEEGNFQHSIGIAYDITESEKNKKELIKAKEDAETSDKIKSEFLAQMSHEIRTPVNSILNFTSLLKAELLEKVSDELKNSFDIIDSGGRRLIRTMDLILNMSQLQTGTYRPSFSQVDLVQDILEDIVSELYSAAAAKGLQLILTVKTDKTTVNVDFYTIVQIFLNLVDNAIKYTEEGIVEIIVDVNENEKLTVSVKDTGIGINEEFIPKLFSPFSQEESGYTRKFEGTGLGLALVKGYVDINKATLSVQSSKGKGSVFTITFN